MCENTRSVILSSANNKWCTPGLHFGPATVYHFLNDLPDSIQSSYLRMFADDTKISNTNILALEQDGKNLVHWASRNEMMFNTDKTVFFSVLYCEAETSFNDFRLSTSKVCKDLGLYITPELSWDEHLKRKLGHLNSLLIRLKRELPVSVGSQVKMVLFKFFFCLVYSIIHRYGIPVKKCLTN